MKELSQKSKRRCLLRTWKEHQHEGHLRACNACEQIYKQFTT